MSTRKELARIAGAIEAASAAPSTRNTAHEDPRVRMPWWAGLALWWSGGPSRARLFQRSLAPYGILAFVGPNGGGKTLAMIALTTPTREGIRWECSNPDHAHTAAGVTSGWRRMLSTVPILGAGGIPHELYDPFSDFQQLVDVEHSDVYMDEVTSVASSRESQRMDARVLNKLMQLRKADVRLFWTAPNWARADKVMREVTQVVIECRGYAPDRSGEGDGVLWRPRRLFKWRAFDSVEFEEWSAAKRDNLDPLSVFWFKGPGSAAFDAYDTLGAVSVVASITPEDTCTVCEGRIVRHVCKGHTRPAPVDLLGAPPLQEAGVASV